MSTKMDIQLSIKILNLVSGDEAAGGDSAL